MRDSPALRSTIRTTTSVSTISRAETLATSGSALVFQAAHLVITVGAIDADGVSDFNPEEAEIAQAMLGQSRTLTVVADSSKLGKTAIFQVCDLKRIQRMVLDEPPASPLAPALSAAGIEIIVAE